MTRDEMLRILAEWDAAQRGLDEQFNAAATILGVDQIDGAPLWEAVFAVADAYTRAVSQIVGDRDRWLAYWQSECIFGRKPREIQISVNGASLRLTLDSLEKLAEVILS